MITEFFITPGEQRKRLDQFLVHREPEISRSSLQRLIELGRIRVNAKIAKSSQKIKAGDHITMDIPQPGQLEINGSPIPLEILHEDESLLVINKPAGIVVHPTSGNWTGTLLNSLLAHFQDTQQTHLTPSFVHRLDKDTSGILVVAKNREAHRALASQFEQHTITRTYEALTWGAPQDDEGMITLAIGRDINNPKIHSCHTDMAHHAITKYHVSHRYAQIASHLILSPQTGRTHQLRVHLASLNVPILGDTVYGGDKVACIETTDIPRHMLHAQTLGFQHPTSGVFQEYTITCPPDMQTVRQKLHDRTMSSLS
ncbi:MAG: RluA family pseudouridine synthase [Nitrospirales bacterium]